VNTNRGVDRRREWQLESAKTERKGKYIYNNITELIMYMKKLLDSDWLRAMQFKCNTSAKSVTPVQITHRNSGL